MKNDDKNLCPHIPPRDPNAETWHNRRALIRRELRRHQLSDSELRIAEIILDMSLGQGLERVLIPTLDCFKELTGIGRPHVSEAIKALREMRIVRVTSVNGVPAYSIREEPDSEALTPFNWRVQPRISLREMERSVDLIREYNSLAPLPSGRTLEALANFKKGHAAQKIAARVPENGTPHGNEYGFREENEPRLL